MPGTFSKSARPKLPGAYTNFVAEAPIVVPAGIGSVVAIPFTHNWGPFKQFVRAQSLGEWESIFGGSRTSPGYIAVQQAFRGEGLPGRGGAGEVLCYRTGAAAAAKATKILQNTTPAAALTVTAVYEGARGNDLRLTVQDYAPDTVTRDELLVLDGTTVLERYNYPIINLADLAAQINGTGAYLGQGSDWVTAAVTLDGVALAPIAATPMTGGADGGTLAAGDWTALHTALEVERFSIYAPFDLTDTAVLASLKTWVAAQNAGGKRFTAVVGGALNEPVATAIGATAGAAMFGDPNVVRVGVGSVSDAGLPDAAGNPTVLSTSQLAPRVAGILAQRGEAESMTFGRLEGCTILVGPSLSDELAAFDGGVVVLGRDSHPDSPVRLGKGLTTFISKSDTTRPYLVYRNPKFVRTMQVFEMEITEYAEQMVIGQLPVNDNTREALVAEMTSRLRKREEATVIQPGWSATVDKDPPPTDDDEFIALLYGMKFGRSVEQVFNTIRVA
jgi:hypothetical protein